MNLLIVTQQADRRDPILGFFHRWIEEFAARCETVTVIAQGAGDFSFPKNVHVLSLGKEQSVPRIFQIVRFYLLLWKHRKAYDTVLVHMTPVWVVLGSPLFIILRKPVYLWYEIRRGGRMLRCALRRVRKVFSATRDGLPFASSKQVVTGHGIDTERFSPATKDGEQHLLLTVGRLTRIKRHELFIRALAQLPPPYRLVVAGGTITADDQVYLRELEILIHELQLEGRVQIGFVPHEELPSLLRSCALYLHAAGGGLDKSLLEAMACGCAVLSASEASRNLLPASCQTTVDGFLEAVHTTLGRSLQERRTLTEDLRKRIVEGHSLPRLIERLIKEMA